MAKVEQKTKANRLAQKIQAALAGKVSTQVTVRATLTGPAAEVWAAIRADGKELGMDEQALMVALLDAGGAALRKALKSIPKM